MTAKRCQLSKYRLGSISKLAPLIYSQKDKRPIPLGIRGIIKENTYISLTYILKN